MLQTIAVVAVVPYGVVQLGSLDQVRGSTKFLSYPVCVFISVTTSSRLCINVHF